MGWKLSYVDAIDVEDVSDDNSNIGLRMSERRRRCDVVWGGIRSEGDRKGFAQICTDSVETHCPLSGNT